MSNSYVKKGDVMEYTAPAGGVTSGTPVLIGNMLVIPQDAAAAGAAFNGHVVGLHTGMPKATGATWSEGQVLYWDDTAKKFTTVTTSNYRVGSAAKAAASGDTTGDVRLNGVAIPTGA